MSEPVLLGLIGLGSAGLTQAVNLLRAKLKSDEQLTLQARQTLLQEAAQIRADLRQEIADYRKEIDDLKKEVQTLRDENLTLRNERMESDRAHREELARVNAEWQMRYGELASRHDEAVRRLEARER
jgi:regulator of replication initiation timing